MTFTINEMTQEEFEEELKKKNSKIDYSWIK